MRGEPIQVRPHGTAAMLLRGRPVRAGTVTGRVQVDPAGTGPFGPGEEEPGPQVLAASAAPANGAEGWDGWILLLPPLDPTPRIPIVCGLEPELFESGDRVTVEGAAATVELLDVQAVPVVTSFLQRPDGKVLLLRRSARVGSFRGVWAGVSGFLEDATPEAQARREILEETGLADADLQLRRSGEPVCARAGPRMFIVHPFRFDVDEPDLRLDWEHDAFDWVDPGEIVRRPTVPRLGTVWRAVEGNAKNR